jgi:hypothetical protein
MIWHRWTLLLFASSISTAALAQVPPPPGTESIAIDRFTGSGDFEGVGPGLGDMIVSDGVMLTTEEGGEFEDCPVIFVVWGKRRAEAQAEVDFQQTPFVDPATRVRPGRFIDPTVMLTGHSEASGGQAHYTVDVRRYPSGELIKRIEGDARDDEFLDEMPERITRELLRLFCHERPPTPPKEVRARNYEGDVHYTAQGEGQSVTLSGKLAWEESAPGTSIFTTSVEINATVSVEGCNKFSGSVPVGGELYLDVPADGRYAFTLATPPNAPMLSCNGIDVPFSIVLNSPPCDGSVENAPKIDASTAGPLVGSGACIDGATLEWNFGEK